MMQTPLDQLAEAPVKRRVIDITVVRLADLA
jgi:hypothetical protein